MPLQNAFTTVCYHRRICSLRRASVGLILARAAACGGKVDEPSTTVDGASAI